MAIDTFFAFIGVYADVDDAKAEKIEAKQLQADTAAIEADAAEG